MKRFMDAVEFGAGNYNFENVQKDNLEVGVRWSEGAHPTDAASPMLVCRSTRILFLCRRSSPDITRLNFSASIISLFLHSLCKMLTNLSSMFLKILS